MDNVNVVAGKAIQPNAYLLPPCDRNVLKLCNLYEEKVIMALIAMCRNIFCRAILIELKRIQAET